MVISKGKSSSKRQLAEKTVTSSTSVTQSGKDSEIMQPTVHQITKSSSTTSATEQKLFTSSSSSRITSQSSTQAYLLPAAGRRSNQYSNVSSTDGARKSDVFLIDSIDLQNVASDSDLKNQFDSVVSIEIQSGGARAQHQSSANKSVKSSYVQENINEKNDVIVESGKSNRKSSNSTFLLSENAASSSGVEIVEVSDVGGSYKNGSSTMLGNSMQSMQTSSNNTIKATSTEMSSHQSSHKSSHLSSSTNMQTMQTSNKEQITASDAMNSTFTSKVYDDKTKTWVAVDRSSTNTGSSSNTVKTGNNNNSLQTSLGEASGGNLLQSHDIVSDSNFSTINTGNTSNISSSVNTQIADSTQMKSTSAKSTHLVSESSISSKKESNRNEKTVKSTRDEVIQVYDNKTKSWISVDSKMVDSMDSKKAKPAYLRYRSQDTDGSWHTIYKRKVFDNISKQWKYYDEKVIRGNDHLTEVPEIIENAQNITTTTYTTKLYDTKTGKWTIVEEKSYVDKDSVNLTNEIKQELERDRPDVANIITTTESTKVIINDLFFR